MTTFFCDSSALVKLYVTETGSAWMRAIERAHDEHLITISRLATVEVAASLARHRREGASEANVRDALSIFASAVRDSYRIIEVDLPICSLAMDLLFRHTLRAFDAMQLAAAVSAARTLSAADLPGLTFLSSDTRLLTAARAEGLVVDDPNWHQPGQGDADQPS